MRNFRKYFDFSSSALGILFSLSGFIVFLFVYHNYSAGVWASLSGVFAALCFHLHYLHWTRRMADHYTAGALVNLNDLGVISMLISIGFFLWYIFAALYWHTPITQISGNSIISAVWCFMTGKWAMILSYISKQYARLVLLSGYDDAPIITTT